ncbi:MAG: hypothetical protein RLN69_05490 [Woeseiaceae bacterium]
MNSINQVIAMSALALLAQSGFACEYPANVSMVNGTTATKEEMIATQAAVKKYVADMEAYLTCIVDEEKSARALISDIETEEEQQREEMLNKKYNAAVEQMERVAAEFNSEVQAYKARDNT